MVFYVYDADLPSVSYRPTIRPIQHMKYNISIVIRITL